MRDPARIDRMLDLLRTIWHRNPDMRLMQLLLNSSNIQLRAGLYTTEDSVTEENLRRAYYLTLEQDSMRKKAVCPRCGASDYIDASQSYDCNRCGKSW